MRFFIIIYFQKWKRFIMIFMNKNRKKNEKYLIFTTILDIFYWILFPLYWRHLRILGIYTINIYFTMHICIYDYCEVMRFLLTILSHRAKFKNNNLFNDSIYAYEYFAIIMASLKLNLEFNWKYPIKSQKNVKFYALIKKNDYFGVYCNML